MAKKYFTDGALITLIDIIKDLLGGKAVKDHNHQIEYTPQGAVTQPEFKGDNVSSGIPDEDGRSIYSITGVGSIASLTASVDHKCLIMSFNGGSAPTRELVDVPSANHTHKVLATGTVSKPDFEGVKETITTGTEAKESKGDD